MLEILSPSAEVTVSKAQKSLAATSKRKRMVNVLDVLEIVKALSSTPSRKIADTSKMQTEAETEPAETEATVGQVSAEAGPSELAEKKPSKIKEKTTEEKASKKTPPEKVATPAPEALEENIDYIIRHASGKNFRREMRSSPLCPKVEIPEGGTGI
jgi:hypothetical protein